MIINRDKCQKLLIGTLGIYAIYCIGSVIQEWIMKMPYLNIRTGEHEQFSNSNAFILVPSIIAWIMGALCNRQAQDTGTKEKKEVPIKNVVVTAGLILLTSLAMTRAIYVTNYPLVTLFKSCNLLSVLTVGVFCSRVKEQSQKLEKKQIVTGLIITVGVFLYHFGAGKQHQEFTGSTEGILLLLFSLVCDGFLPDLQAEIKTKYKPTAMEMFQLMNKWKTILSLLYACLTLQIRYVLTFYWEHPISLVHMLILGTSGAVGQMVVYWMINNFKQHIVPFVITTRKIFTVVISILFFKHEATVVQGLGILLVFATVFYDFLNEIGIKPEKEIQAMVAESNQNSFRKVGSQEDAEIVENQIADMSEMVKSSELHRTSDSSSSGGSPVK